MAPTPRPADTKPGTKRHGPPEWIVLCVLFLLGLVCGPVAGYMALYAPFVVLGILDTSQW